MATVLEEMQFELLQSVDDSAGVVFGAGGNVSIEESGFTPGSSDWITQDQTNPNNGVTKFGRDKITGPTWAWEMFINREDTATGLESYAEISTAWRMEQARDTPGAVLALRYRVGGRVRRVYGRPRRFDGSPNNLILNGMIPFAADFKCVDGYTYDDEPSSIILGLQAGSEGGFIFPIVMPITTLPVGTQQSHAYVSGDAPTYPVIRINGPVENPEVSSPTWDLTLDLSLGVDDYVVIDTRPWALTATLNGTTSVAGKLGARQWLSDIRLYPGSNQMVFRGSGVSDDSSCEVLWNNAWNSL